MKIMIENLLEFMFTKNAGIRRAYAVRSSISLLAILLVSGRVIN